MTTLPTKQNKKLGLVIDLDICVGCHACAVNCKEWNTSGHSSPLHDVEPYGDDPTGVWFNRIHTFEVETEGKSIDDVLDEIDDTWEDDSTGSDDDEDAEVED